MRVGGDIRRSNSSPNIKTNNNATLSGRLKAYNNRNKVGRDQYNVSIVVNIRNN